MRTRNGNIYNEIHGNAMRVYDWVAPVGTVPEDIPAQVEATLGVKIHQDAPGAAVDGYVNTSLRPDDSRYVSVQLYDTPCPGVDCSLGHTTTPFRVAPKQSTTNLAAMVVAVGEHPQHKLRNAGAAALMRNLGFGENDAPVRSS